MCQRENAFHRLEDWTLSVHTCLSPCLLHVQNEFYLRIDSFPQHERGPHFCDSLSFAKRRIWIASKAKEAIIDQPSVTPSEMRDILKKKHKITIDLATLSGTWRNIRNDAQGWAVFFWHIATFFENLSSVNEGTTTSLTYEGRTFLDRSPIAECVCWSSHTICVLGLDWCHVKAGYGNGGMLPMLMSFDWNSHFPGSPGHLRKWKWRNQGVVSVSGAKDIPLFWMRGGLVFSSYRRKGITKQKDRHSKTHSTLLCLPHLAKKWWWSTKSGSMICCWSAKARPPSSSQKQSNKWKHRAAKRVDAENIK